jgi:hypothetical protein
MQRFKIMVTIIPIDKKGNDVPVKKRLTLKNFKGRPKRYGGPSLTRPADHPHRKSFDPSELER